MISINRISAALALALLVCPFTARATTVLAPSEDELVTGAVVIAMAVVERTEVVISPRGQVMTHAELKVERGVRGVSDGEFISMDYPGGRLDNGVVSTVPGSPQLKTGDRVFAYLRPNTAGALVPIGLRFGVLDVHRDMDGQLRATRHLDGLTFVDKTGEPAPNQRFVLRNMSIEDLIGDAQSRMLRLGIKAGTQNQPRGISLPVVHP